ncbi:MAG: sigma-70 family RNA polymerase sigma factor [Bryobacteraceae bacterium]|nr:sigma-70 family RNA polymerase sigma factor [Bryobacteraceae bacterium]
MRHSEELVSFPRAESDSPPAVVDAALLSRCQRGERAALEELVERVQGRVYNFALRACGSVPAAEDVTQRVLMKMVREVGAFRAEASFTSWLYRIVVNEWIDERRRVKRLVYWPVETLARWRSARPGPEQLEGRREREEAVLAAVGRLEPKLRAVVLLRYLEDLSYEEVAAALGCSMGTVASRLSRAHARLREELGAYRDEV